MLPEIGKAKIVITNYHAFQHRETLAAVEGRAQLPAGTRRAAQDDRNRSRDAGAGLRQAAAITTVVKSSTTRRITATAQRLDADDEAELKGDEKEEAEERRGRAPLDQRHRGAGPQGLGVRAVYDLSATPFFLRGSGYAEGTLFPWVVSDFSLMDAIESGIVKLPRVPVTDNLRKPIRSVYRDLWKHIGKDLPKTGAGAGKLSPFDLPNMLQTALTCALQPLREDLERLGARRDRACRRSSSSSARTPRSRSSSSNGSPASSAATPRKASAQPSMPAIWSCSATTTTRATALPARARC